MSPERPKTTPPHLLIRPQQAYRLVENAEALAKALLYYQDLAGGDRTHRNEIILALRNIIYIIERAQITKKGPNG